MKNTIYLTLFLLSITSIFAQPKISEIKVDPRLHETMSETEINNLLQNNPKEIVLANFDVAWYCYFTSKLPGDPANYIQRGDIIKYLKPGKKCDYNKILEENQINKLNFNFPQDQNKSNVFSINNSGYYIVVIPKTEYDQRKQEIARYYGF
ncbi:MAG: hypothetical protein RR356_00115 [Bacteroidales bacterium]